MTPESRPAGGISQMISYWKWKCEQCAYEFILTLLKLPDACHRCGGQWFLKIGESEDKHPAIAQ